MKDTQKIRPLAIYQLLKNCTDSAHPMGSFEIANTLNLEGLPTSIKEVKDDVKLLKEWGFQVGEVQGEDAYYILGNLFDSAELRVLIDAVSAASFISEKKSDDLIKKLSILGGARKGEIYKSTITLLKTNKHTNEAVVEAVGTIDNSIIKGKKCSFLYFDYDVEGARVYRKDKKRYVVNPLTLVVNENNYYLLAYGEHYDTVTTYRVDRMAEVMGEELEIRRAEFTKDFDLNSYRKQAFSMFKGELTEVSLECDASTVDGIVDKFSESVNMLKINDKTFRVKVKVQVSPTFFGWVATAGGRIKITAPEEVKKSYYEHLSKC